MVSFVELLILVQDIPPGSIRRWSSNQDDWVLISGDPKLGVEVRRVVTGKGIQRKSSAISPSAVVNKHVAVSGGDCSTLMNVSNDSAA